MWLVSYTHGWSPDPTRSPGSRLHTARTLNDGHPPAPSAPRCEGRGTPEGPRAVTPSSALSADGPAWSSPPRSSGEESRCSGRSPEPSPPPDGGGSGPGEGGGRALWLSPLVPPRVGWPWCLCPSRRPSLRREVKFPKSGSGPVCLYSDLVPLFCLRLWVRPFRPIGAVNTGKHR